jgi:hypothetical protein
VTPGGRHPKLPLATFDGKDFAVCFRTRRGRTLHVPAGR